MPDRTTAAEPCGACGQTVRPRVADTVRHLLRAYQPHQHAVLAELFNGTAPGLLCPGCFNAATGQVNARLREARRAAA
jgi:hypothetical protein